MLLRWLYVRARRISSTDISQSSLSLVSFCIIRAAVAAFLCYRCMHRSMKFKSKVDSTLDRRGGGEQSSKERSFSLFFRAPTVSRLLISSILLLLSRIHTIYARIHLDKKSTSLCRAENENEVDFVSPVICYSVCTCWTSTCHNRSLEQPPRDYNWLLFLSKRKNSRRRIVRIGSGAFSWHCRRFLSLVVLREQIFIMIELCG